MDIDIKYYNPSQKNEYYVKYRRFLLYTDKVKLNVIDSNKSMINIIKYNETLDKQVRLEPKEFSFLKTEIFVYDDKYLLEKSNPNIDIFSKYFSYNNQYIGNDFCSRNHFHIFNDTKIRKNENYNNIINDKNIIFDRIKFYIENNFYINSDNQIFRKISNICFNISPYMTKILNVHTRYRKDSISLFEISDKLKKYDTKNFIFYDHLMSDDFSYRYKQNLVFIIILNLISELKSDFLSSFSKKSRILFIENYEHILSLLNNKNDIFRNSSVDLSLLEYKIRRNIEEINFYNHDDLIDKILYNFEIIFENEKDYFKNNYENEKKILSEWKYRDIGDKNAIKF